RLHALDTASVTENANARSRFGRQQQPRDRVGIRAVVTRCGVAGHLAAIVRLPRGPGVVLADLLAGRVEEVGFGCPEDPLETRRVVLAGLAVINLHTDSVRLER